MSGMTVVTPVGSTFRMFVDADFNDLGWDKKDHVTVLIDYWLPSKGALVTVRDEDGNSMNGVIVKVWRTVRCKPWETLALVKCDRATWKDGQP